jgi:phosphatidylethanolamine/phosphatidyl-N-methylethanolamine N-methyltransferase
MNAADQIRKQILDSFYLNVYQKFLFSGGVQGKGIDYFEKQVENFWENPKPQNVLEIGGGSGEHLKFIRYIPTDSYISFDIRPIITKDHLRNLSDEFKSRLSFVEGDAHSLPFKDETFDRVFTTCLLHHVNDVLAVLLEARRVTVIGGELAFLLPMDPGILNQLVKKMVSIRKIKQLTKIRPQLIYALEHKNHVQSILEQIRFVYQLDEVKFNYRPFSFIRSWNFNLLVVVKIVKR